MPKLDRLNLLAVALLLAPAMACALNIQVTYGHRHIHEGWSQPPADFREGAVTATFTATAAIDTAFIQRGLTQVDSRTWSRVFTWDETDSVTFFFVDGDERLHEVRTCPAWPPFEPAERSVPVAIIDTEPDALWSPADGIYVWGDGDVPNWDQRGSDWERDATFRWYDRHGVLRHQRPIGLRINGSFTRNRAQKSLRLYFDHHGDPDTIVDDFFGSLPHEHERLILRAGSDGPHLFLRDVTATTLFAAAGHECCRWTPAEVFLGNEYWGLYHLRERPDDEWAEITLGLDGDYILIKDGESVVGDRQVWRDFLEAAAADPEPGDNAFHEWLATELDLVSYLDWALLQCWSGASDNGGQSNLVTVRPEGGRWRFIAYDQDGSFASGNRTHDFFWFFASADQEEFDARRPPEYYPVYSWNCRPLFDLWRQVMSNPRGRRLARERWRALYDGVFSAAHATALVDSIVAVQEDAAARQYERWDWTSTLAGSAESMCNNIEIRQPTADAQFTAFLEQWMDPVELDGFTVDGPAEAPTISWHAQREIDCASWVVERREGDGGNWRVAGAVAATGGPDQPATYEITDGNAPADPDLQYRLYHLTTGGTIVVHPWIESWVAPTAVPSLVINEFLASNDTVNADETGAYEDWVEIHNAGAATASLDGVYLTDDLATPLAWPLPAGLTLEPGAFLLIWCDDDPQDGPLHATFKLSASGESVGIFLDTGADVVALDTHDFGPQVTDVSEGRLPDGGSNWVSFDTPTPGASNTVAAAEGPPPPLALTVWPNPFNPACSLAVQMPESGPVQLAVYDLAGRRVRVLCDEVRPSGRHEFAFDGRNERGAALASGVYHAVLRTDSEWSVVKLTLVR